MSKRTKAELLQDLENMTLEKDIEYDRAEKNLEEINDLEEIIEELRQKEETHDILLDLIDRLYVATIRLNGGIETEREEIEKLTEKLLDMRSIN